MERAPEVPVGGVEDAERHTESVHAGTDMGSCPTPTLDPDPDLDLDLDPDPDPDPDHPDRDPEPPTEVERFVRIRL